MDPDIKKTRCSLWFEELRNKICMEFEKIEDEYWYSEEQPIPLEVPQEKARFNSKKWNRRGGGGGEMAMMRGNVFEKVGVNISTVYGEFSEDFRSQIPGTQNNPQFWASGISLVAHMRSPLVPAVHMNTRFIVTSKEWFGGGADLNPIYPIFEDTERFHAVFKKACDKYNDNYYPQFKKACDEYFYIKHRQEPRGVGGIFYDYHNSGDFEQDFNFTRDVGLAFLEIFPKLVMDNMLRKWSEEQRQYQLIKRGHYTEFNLIYDRGTKFGLMTDGNVEAVLMSLPPLAGW